MAGLDVGGKEVETDPGTFASENGDGGGEERVRRR